MGFGDGQAADVVAAGVVEEDGDGLLAEGEDGGGAVSGGQVVRSVRGFGERRMCDRICDGMIRYTRRDE